MTAPSQEVPVRAKNQSSIDRILNLPESLAERRQIYERGFKEAKRQGILSHDVSVIPRLDEIKLVHRDPMGRYRYRDSIKDSERAIAALKANPTWLVADGVYEGAGKIVIYATATSANTLLIIPSESLLHERFRSDLSFRFRLSDVENVLQTITHEVGHHSGLNHGDASLYNGEYFAIKRYRAQL